MIFCCLFFLPFISGYFDEYINPLNVFTAQGKHASAPESGFGFHRSIDNSKDTVYRNDENRYNVSDAWIKVYMFNELHYSVDKLRLMKVRNGTESLKILLFYSNKNLNKELIIPFKVGWNDIDILDKKGLREIRVTMNDTIYPSMEIAEIQVLESVRLFYSCMEWYELEKIHNSKVINLYDKYETYYNDIASINAGAKCSSSGGECVNAIKDSAIFYDDIWIPSSIEHDFYIRIEFFRSHLVREIKVNQPLENDVDLIYIQNQDRMIEMIPETANNWTIINTERQTKWLKFLIEKDLYRIFNGIYEIKAFSYLPRIKLVWCSKKDDMMVTKDRMPYGNHPFIFNPTTSKECSKRYEYFASNW